MAKSKIPTKDKKTKKVETTTTSNKKVETLLKEMRAEGYRGLYVGGEIKDHWENRIPSDIFGVNVITRGGIPVNGITEIFGPASSFKTTAACGFVKEAQKKWNNNTMVVWVLTEGMLDLNWARHIGAKIPYAKEEIASFRRDGLDDEAIKKLQVAQDGGGLFVILNSGDVEDDIDKARQLLETGEVSLHIFDSLGAISAEAERVASLKDTQVTVNPKLITKYTKALLNIGTRLSNVDKGTAVLLINQIRANIGGYGPVKTMRQGGHALSHNAHLRLEMKSAEMMRTDDNVWGKVVKIKCDKSKICVPHRTCEMTFMTRPDNPRKLPIGPDVYAEVVSLAKDAGLLQHAGKQWLFNGQEVQFIDMPNGEERAAKADELVVAFQQQPALLEQAKEMILRYHRRLEIGGA